MPQAGLDTTARASPLAQVIVSEIAEKNVDPDQLLLYNPVAWRNASHVPFDEAEDWMSAGTLEEKIVNGRKDVFSQRLGQECQPFGMTPPDEGLFEPANVVIVSNGRYLQQFSRRDGVE